MKKEIVLALNALIGIIVIAATLAVFFIGFPAGQKTTIDYLSLTFVLISEVVLFGTAFCLTLIKSGTVFSYSGILTTLVLYFLATLISTILLNPVFKSLNNTGMFATVQILIIAVAAVILIVFVLASSSFKTKDASTQSVGTLMRSCESTAFTLKSGSVKPELAGPLNSLYEDIKYADKSTTLPEVEAVILSKLNELGGVLASADDAESETKIDEIRQLVKKRNETLRQTKRGGF